MATPPEGPGPGPAGPEPVPGAAEDALRRLEERLDRASEAAERLMAEVAAEAAQSAGGGGRAEAAQSTGGGGRAEAAQSSGGGDRADEPVKPPPAGWQIPDPGGAAGDPDPFLALVQSLRDLIPPDLQRRILAALRELLLALRALIDWYLDRLERSREQSLQVEDIPIL